MPYLEPSKLLEGNSKIIDDHIMEALSSSMHFYKVTELDLNDNTIVTEKGYTFLANSDYAVNIEKIHATNSSITDEILEIISNAKFLFSL